MKIKAVKAIEVLDSRGKPTIRTFITLIDDSIHSATVPSGASIGSHEALELRDNNPKYHLGAGVKKAVENVNTILAKTIIGMTVKKPDIIDKKMIEIDGTPDKSQLGANAILSVSMAVARAAAYTKKQPLWKFLNRFYFQGTKPTLPRIMFNVVNGGKHANWNFDIQEFIIMPRTNKPSLACQIGAEIYQTIAKLLKEKKLSVLVGDEGGFSPALNSNEEAFQLIAQAGELAGYNNDQDYQLGIDAAASEFFSKDKYILKKDSREISGKDLLSYYLTLKGKYKIYSFEDVFAEDDWKHFSKFMFENLSALPSLVIGDDLFCTDIKRMKIGQEENAANAIIIKPNQIGTILETVAAIKLAREYNWKVIVSHRSGETEDTFIADLAYGSAADFLKNGTPCRSERTAKYNRLIEIENGY